MNRFFKHYRLWGALVLIVLLFLLGRHLTNFSVEELVSYTPPSLLLAALIFLALYCVKALVMVPPVLVLYIAAGMVFSSAWAIVITYVGLICEMSIGYWLGKKMGRSKVIEMTEKSKKASRILEFNGNNDDMVCFVARVAPVPFELGSMFFGATGVTFKRYLFFSLMGTSPAMIPCVIAAGAIRHPFSKEFLFPFGISISITVAVFIVFHLFLKKRG